MWQQSSSSIFCEWTMILVNKKRKEFYLKMNPSSFYMYNISLLIPVTCPPWDILKREKKSMKTSLKIDAMKQKKSLFLAKKPPCKENDTHKFWRTFKWKSDLSRRCFAKIMRTCERLWENDCWVIFFQYCTAAALSPPLFSSSLYFALNKW